MLSDIVRRVDKGDLRPAHRTEEGYLFLDGIPAKTGVLTYVLADGSVVRELCLPEELSNPDSLSSLGRKPVTLDHPPAGAVTPDTFQDFAVGGLGETVSFDEASGFVKVTLSVHRRDAIQAIENGTRELSCGYQCKLEDSAGWWSPSAQKVVEQGQAEDAQHFDKIQRGRRYNHLALTRAGRAGREARVRLDASGWEAQEETMAKVKLCDAELEVPESIVGAIQGAQSRLEALLVEKEKLLGELSAAKQALEGMEPKGDRMAWFPQRRKLDKLARELGCKVDGKDLDQLTDSELMRQVLQTSMGPNVVKVDASDEYLKAYVDFLADIRKDGKLAALPVQPAAKPTMDKINDDYLARATGRK